MANFGCCGHGARRLGVIGALVLGLCAAPPAEAQAVDEASRTAARALGNSGVELYQAGSYKEASERLEKAYAIVRVPSLGLWSARALGKLGYLVEAANRYLETVSLQIPTGDFEIQKQAQADAQKELDALRPSIPAITIQIEGARPEEVKVWVDGTPLSATLYAEPRLVNPGLHKVEASHGAARTEASVTLAEGQKAPAVLRFGAAMGAPTKGQIPPAKPAEEAESGVPTGTLGLVALGVGGAGIVVGAIAGGMALGKKGTIDSSPACEGRRCSDRSLVESYGTLRTVSTVGFIAGGVLAGLGVTLLLTSSSEQQSETAALLIGPGSVNVRGRF